MALLAIRTRWDVRRRGSGRCRRRHHHNFRNAGETRHARAMTFNAGSHTRVAHLGTGELGAVRYGCRGHTGAGAHVADLTRLGGRQVIRGQTDDAEVGRRNRESRCIRTVTLAAIIRFARRIGVDVDQRRHHRIVAVLMAIGARRRRSIRNVVRRLHDAVEVIEVIAVAGDAIARGRVGGILDHEGTRHETRSGLEACVVRASRERRGVDGVLAHRHPGVTTLVAALAIRGNACVDLPIGRRGREEQGSR